MLLSTLKCKHATEQTQPAVTMLCIARLLAYSIIKIVIIKLHKIVLVCVYIIQFLIPLCLFQDIRRFFASTKPSNGSTSTDEEQKKKQKSKAKVKQQPNVIEMYNAEICTEFINMRWHLQCTFIFISSVFCILYCYTISFLSL